MSTIYIHDTGSLLCKRSIVARSPHFTARAAAGKLATT